MPAFEDYLDNHSLLSDDSTTHRAIRENIETICRLEERFQTKRKFSEKIASAVSSFSGSLTFVCVQTVAVGIWMGINTGVLPWTKPFDPFPFNILNISVSLEAVFLATFVMIKQNRMGKRADSRAHLDLQINLLAENEMTAMLQMLRLIAKQVGVKAPDLEGSLEQLSAETPVEVMAHAIERRLPNDD